MAETQQGTRINMPKLGESVTEGTIAGWFKKVGERVERYEPMVEVVTDKVNAEVPAPITGTILEIIMGEGEIVPVGEAICIIDAGEQAGAEITPGAQPAEDEEPEMMGSSSASKSAKEDAEDSDRTVVMSASHIDEIEPAGEMLDTDAVQTPPANGRSVDRQADLRQARKQRDEEALLQIRSSPLVRRLAEEYALDLSQIEGTGIGGRVTKSDVEDVIKRASAVPDSAEATAASQQAERQPRRAPAPIPEIQVMPGDEVIEASTMRRQIADHMVRSVQTAPHVTVWMEVDMTRVVNARESAKAVFSEREGFSLTYVPLIASVVIKMLRQRPEINAAWDAGRIIRRRSINVGLAVAIEDGLIVPVVKHADELNIVGLARAINDLVNRTRDGKLTPDDVAGGTFTLNNPGALGSLMSTPILVQPQAAILSMEAIVKRPVVIDDMIGARPMMNLSLSVDHRLLDGLAATRFLSDVKQGLEEFPEDIRNS